MADRSSIEWTDATWNPIRARNKATGKVGWHCEHVTPGCEHCYAERDNHRFGTKLPFKPGHRKDVEIFLDETMLTQPLRWKKPRKIFPCSMTDLFADFVTDEMLDKIFAVMALTPHHIYQPLTKRAQRMHDYITDPDTGRGHICTMARVWDIADTMIQALELPADHPAWKSVDIGLKAPWPLPNVWLGVSTERQQEADERIPLLLDTPAAIRFISAEPLLGPIDLEYIDQGIKALTSSTGPNLDWVIAGGESGPKARSSHPDWFRSLRDQCAAASVAFHFKQFGEWAPSTPEAAAGNPQSGWKALAAYPHVAKASELYPEAGAAFVERVGKKAAGRLLDGVEHNEFPAARAT